MPVTHPFTIRRLTADDVALMEAMLTMFGEAFDEVETYTGKRPSAAYLKHCYAAAISSLSLH